MNRMINIVKMLTVQLEVLQLQTISFIFFSWRIIALPINYFKRRICKLNLMYWFWKKSVLRIVKKNFKQKNKNEDFPFTYENYFKLE